MSKKDYIRIAKAIELGKQNAQENGIYHESANSVAQAIVSALCIELKEENPKFNSNRFIEACGFEVE